MKVLSPKTGNPLLCFYGDCQAEADDAFTTAPIIDADTGEGYSYVHCSLAHMLATMSEHPDFADLPSNLFYEE